MDFFLQAACFLGAATLIVPIFRRFGFGDVLELLSERTRVTVGLGYILNQTWFVELRYTRQKSRDTLTEKYLTTDNIFDLRFRTSIRIRDLLKSW